MTRLLKQSTAATLRGGPFLDSTTGVDAETSLTIAQGDIQISKNGGAFAQTSDASPTTTHDADGWYPIPLTATDTNTLGPLTVQVAVSGALPVWEHFMVVPANVYDSLVGGSDNLQVDAVQIEGGDATDAINAAADTAIADASLATASALSTAQADLDTLTGADGATLATLQPNYAPATAASVAALNDVSTSDVQTAAAAALTAYDPPTNAELTAGLTALNDLSAAEIRAALGMASADLDTQLDAIVADTNELQADWANGGRLDLLIDAILEDTGTTIPALIAALNDLSAAEVNAEIVDALSVDTYAEPGSVPAATATLAAKLGWLFFLARNRITQTATTQTAYADDGSTSVATAGVSDDGTTFTKNEWS